MVRHVDTAISIGGIGQGIGQTVNRHRWTMQLQLQGPDFALAIHSRYHRAHWRWGSWVPAITMSYLRGHTGASYDGNPTNSRAAVQQFAAGLDLEYRASTRGHSPHAPQKSPSHHPWLQDVSAWLRPFITTQIGFRREQLQDRTSHQAIAGTVNDGAAIIIDSGVRLGLMERYRAHASSHWEHKPGYRSDQRNKSSLMDKLFHNMTSDLLALSVYN